MNGGDSLPLDVLPPAIGADEAPGPASDEAPAKPRRRARSRPAEDDSEAAPAA
ncbi:MAG TPA: hypothetical protein VFP57_04430 [Sphingomicrobium sp.]|nr:hypothetical protein [Sphingomicrobium sp.]